MANLYRQNRWKYIYIYIYSQNTYYQIQTTSKVKNNNSANFESFVDKIDTSNSVQKQPELDRRDFFRT